MITYEYISEDHDDLVQSFLCDDEISVEIFLKEEALQLHRLQTAITRLYFDNENNLVGYFTLHNDLVHLLKSQIERYRREFEWDLPRYKYLPAVKLHYLGVDRRHREKGIGEYLLREAIQTIHQTTSDIGCNFITIQALNSARGFYEKYGFISRENDRYYVNMIFKLSELE